MSSVHHELPSTGFATSTIFTLGTDDGVILIHMHTDNNQLHFFGTFVRRGHFDITYHWMLRAKDPKVRCARVCMTVAGLVL